MSYWQVTAVEVVQLPNGEGLGLPAYQTAGSGAMDLCAAIDDGEAFWLGPGERRLVGAGFKMALPPGHVGLVFARSGLALKHGLVMANGVGVIDSDYRGEVGVLLFNSGEKGAVTIRRGMRLAQLLVVKCESVRWTEVPALADTERGSGGFGSTGG